MASIDEHPWMASTRLDRFVCITIGYCDRIGARRLKLRDGEKGFGRIRRKTAMKRMGQHHIGTMNTSPPHGIVQ